MSKQFYQVGGSLPANAKSYIKRDADNKLYNYLKEGKYAYVLNARQVGKSSLRVHTSKRLNNDGYSCVNIDLTSIGSEDITADEWYFSFVYQIIEQLELEEDEFIDWWDANDKLTIVNRFSKVFDKFILEKSTQNIIIMIDEVDSILGIKKDFSANDFFAVIRTFYNLRSEDERYKRVTFALFGVATPEDLMRDSSRTPFNIAHSVKIAQFKLEESLSLIDGLENQNVESREILEKIFEWTSGTPYLTQKILDYIVHNPIEKVEDVDNIVDILFIQENFKEINISNIQNRILSNDPYSIKMLYLIGKIISDEKVLADDGSLEQIYLKLSGLVKDKGGVLLYTNKIYQQLFNQTWLDESMSKIDRPFAKDLQRWVELNRTNSALLKGEVLIKAIEWASESVDLTFDENEYLRLSIQGEQEQRLEEEKKRGQSKLLKLLLGSLIIFLFIGGGLVYFYLKNKEKSSLLQLATKNIDRRLNRIDIEAEIENSEDNHYEIPKSLETKVKIDLNLLEKFTLIDNSIINTSSSLVQLIIYTKKKRFDKQLWLNTISSMSYMQKNKLFNILVYSAYSDEAVVYTKNNEYNKVIPLYKKAMKINPKSVEIYKNIGMVYNKLGRYDKAIEVYEEALKINPKNAEIYNNLGVVYNKTNKYDKAIEVYEEALKINPKNVGIYNNLGVVYHKTNKYDKAIEVYEKAIKINPNNAEIYNNLGVVYSITNKYDKAIAVYKKSIGINQYDADVYNRVGEIYAQRDEDDKAIKIYEKILKINPSNVIVYRVLLEKYNNFGELYLSQGNDNKALGVYKKIIILDKNASDIYDEKILKIYQKNEEYNKAINYFQERIKKNNKDSSAYYTLGKLYQIKKNYKSSLNVYQKALKLNPNNRKYHYSIFKVFSLMKKYDEAIDINNKIQNLNTQIEQKDVSKVDKYAKSFLDIPYVWGAKGDKSFDSSGFTQRVYKGIGISIPRVSKEQSKKGKYVRYKNLQLGDLVFFDTSKEHLRGVTHVGMYLQDGDFIHASSAGKKVMITNFKKKDFYKNSFLWGRRLIKGKEYQEKEKFDLYYELGNIYTSKKEYKKALKQYQKTIDINSKVSDVYIKFFELQLIQGVTFNNKLEERYIKQFQNKKEKFIKYEMLQVLQNIKNGKKNTIDKWEKRYKGIDSTWNFNNLNIWANNINSRKIKQRVLDVLSRFRKDKEIDKVKQNLPLKVKDKKAPFSQEGWVYLGEFEKGKWKSKSFDFDRDTNPLKLIGTIQIMTSPLLNVREMGYGSSIINQLHRREKVKIISVQSVFSTTGENEGYMWARVKY